MGPLPRAVVRAWPHVVAAILVAAGIAAELLRPLAPEIGAPIAASEVFSPDYLARAAAYRQPIVAAQLTALLVRVGLAFAIAYTPLGRRTIDRVVRRFRRPPAAAAATAAVIVVVIDLCLLPLAFAVGYVHDGRFGLRTQGLGGWVVDWLVFHVPVWGAVAVVAALGFWLVRRLPRTWPVAVGVSLAVLSAGVVVLAPLVLEPAQHRLTPLEAGPDRDEVETILARAGVQGAPILVADASRRSPRQNAYISGLGATRRIVLYDTLLTARPPDEVGVVLAHEIGHHRAADQLRSLAFGVAGSIAAAYALYGVAASRTARGLQQSPTDPRGAPVLVAVATLLVVLSLPVQLAASRRAESAADAAALELTAAPATVERMQLALSQANLADPAPPAWVQLLWGSHPSTVERITRARRWEPASGSSP